MKARRPVAALGVMFALVGCTLTQNDVRTDALLPPGGLGRTGQVIVPKQCALKMVIPSRPLHDQALNDAIWLVADSRAIDDEARRVLEANGLRVGVVTGELPEAVRTVLDAPPPNKVDPAIVIMPDGENTLVDLGAAKSELTLFLNRDGRTAGKPYKDAKGHLRVTVQRAADDSVTLRIVPEVHHGPIRQNWGTAPSGGTFAPQQLVTRTGQTEESLRELTASLVLRPGQVAVIGADPDRKGSLGHFLFTAPEANSDRLLQKVLFIWAAKSESGESDLLPPNLEPYEPEIPEDGPLNGGIAQSFRASRDSKTLR